MMYIRWMVLLLTVFSINAFAATQTVAVKLAQIKAIKTSEKMGDELYFSITQYSNQSAPMIFREPMFPMHWRSKDLYKLQDVLLWQGTIKDEESVLLIFSLLEQDLAPWNPDDHVGSVQVKIINTAGKVDITWGQPEFRDQPRVDQTDKQQPNFVMYGDGSEYKVKFNLTVND